jgi:hypothetical protein
MTSGEYMNEYIKAATGSLWRVMPALIRHVTRHLNRHVGRHVNHQYGAGTV